MQIDNSRQQQKKQPMFKSSGGAITLIGNMMQGIENQGYFASFLIQDGLGMTFPRIWTGFNRDKEITGKYNIQEGWEVAYREGLTGPFMIAAAPLVLFFTTKFCRSTNTNTNLIKRYGEALKNFVKQSHIDKTIKENPERFKSEFVRFNIEEIYRQSVPKDLNSEEAIKYILEEFKNLSSKDKKLRKTSLKNIVDKFNEKVTETSSNLYDINKVKIGKNTSLKSFNTKDAIIALNDFCEDSIINNKAAKAIDEFAAENIKNNFIAKRMFTNIANIALTLVSLSIIPKIYAKNDVAPSAQVLEHLKNKKEAELNEEEKNNKEKISFKGRGINFENVFSRIGKILAKKIPEKFSELFEYVGYNFTKTTFACLSLFGLLLPRGKKAWDRAQIDENGKRDMTEIKEIGLRDTVSSMTVVFAVPILTKIFVKAYENKLGFILTNKASESKNKFKKFLDVINPYSKLEVLSIADLDAIYGNIDSKLKLMNFAEFINKKGGDLEKIISKSENAKLLFNEETFTLNSIKNLPKAEKNNKILKVFKDIESSDPKAKNELIAKLMKGSSPKSNKIVQTVRGLNSLPGFISTFIISPVLLGVLIPKLTYSNTRKAHERRANEMS